MEIIAPSPEENACLDGLAADDLRYVEMTESERRFVNALVLRHKPKKALEIGVSAGGSSVVILNALRQNGEGLLYAVDLLDHYYADPSRKAGFLIDGHPDLQDRYRLFTGRLAHEFMEEIGGGIDFCFIDTKHLLPGEVLDFLMAYPYLADNCVVVLHDIKYHTFSKTGRNIATAVLQSAIGGKKVMPPLINVEEEEKHTPFANIGGTILDGSTGANIWNVFNLLTLEWAYTIDQSTAEALEKFVKSHYAKELADYFSEAMRHQKSREKIFDPADVSQGQRYRYLFKFHAARIRSLISSGRKKNKYLRRMQKYATMLNRRDG